MARGAPRGLIGALAAVALAGCGGGSSSSDTTTAARSAARPACSPRVGAAIAPRAAARMVSDEASTLVCDYTAGGTRVRVTIDTLPQAYERWNRAQVETWQNYAGWNRVPSRAPRLVNGLGLGAFWIPHDRRLVATAGGRLVTVVVRAPRAGAAALRLATGAARAALPAHARAPARHGP